MVGIEELPTPQWVPLVNIPEHRSQAASFARTLSPHRPSPETSESQWATQSAARFIELQRPPGSQNNTVLKTAVKHGSYSIPSMPHSKRRWQGNASQMLLSFSYVDMYHTCIYMPNVTVCMQVCPNNFIKLACSVVNMAFVYFNPHGRRQTRWLRKKNVWFFTQRLKKQSVKQK